MWLDHDNPFNPGKFCFEPVLQAPDQGHSRNVSTPAETCGSDLYRASVDSGEGHFTVLRLILPAHLGDDRFDLFDVLFQTVSPVQRTV